MSAAGGSERREKRKADEKGGIHTGRQTGEAEEAGESREKFDLICFFYLLLALLDLLLCLANFSFSFLAL